MFTVLNTSLMLVVGAPERSGVAECPRAVRSVLIVSSALPDNEAVSRTNSLMAG